MFVHLKIMDPCEGMELQPVAHGSLYLLVCRREDDVTSRCIFFKIRTRDIICLSGCVCNGFKSCRRTLESLRRLKRECEMQTQIVLAANGIVKPRDEVVQELAILWVNWGLQGIQQQCPWFCQASIPVALILVTADAKLWGFCHPGRARCCLWTNKHTKAVQGRYSSKTHQAFPVHSPWQAELCWKRTQERFVSCLRSCKLWMQLRLQIKNP